MERWRNPPIFPRAYASAAFSSKRRISIMSASRRRASSASTAGAPAFFSSVFCAMSPPTAPLPPHHAQLVHREPLAYAEDRDDDGKPDGNLGRRHRHHKEHQSLPVGIAGPLAERHQREVRGIQRQFDGHENHEWVPANDDTDHTNGEERRGKRVIPRPGDHQRLAPRSAPRGFALPRGLASGGAPCGFALPRRLTSTSSRWRIALPRRLVSRSARRGSGLFRTPASGPWPCAVALP